VIAPGAHRTDIERMATTDSAKDTPPQSNDSNAVRSAAIVITVVMSIAALKLGRAVVLPVVVAVLLTLLLSAPVRWLRRRKIPEQLGGAIVVFGAVGIAIGAAAMLVTPATELISTAPANFGKIETKVRSFMQPIAELQQSAEHMATAAAPASPTGRAPAQVQIATSSMFDHLMQVLELVPAALSVVFLTYFLLASGPLFRKKIAQILPGRRDVLHLENILSEIELVTSKFLATATMINSGVGVATALSLWAAGMPNPILFGFIVAVLNFVPYLGPISSFTIISLASLASFDEPTRAFIAPACFLAIHLVENNLITPMLLGRRLPVNTVAIFLGLIFFGWIWGIPGAVLAVPLTTVVKIACDHVPNLKHFGELLGN
jgi:predicted PurR-regulated permease PerM